mmetsp:Transcript_17409/g.60800  ORF Transcript_17409/g.60800 Transcript_17409/m.60800 type:complete len:226 (+) Transcript_17409:336-1013(+)
MSPIFGSSSALGSDSAFVPERKGHGRRCFCFLLLLLLRRRLAAARFTKRPLSEASIGRRGSSPTSTKSREAGNAKRQCSMCSPRASSSWRWNARSQPSCWQTSARRVDLRGELDEGLGRSNVVVLGERPPTETPFFGSLRPPGLGVLEPSSVAKLVVRLPPFSRGVNSPASSGPSKSWVGGLEAVRHPCAPLTMTVRADFRGRGGMTSGRCGWMTGGGSGAASEL